MSGRRISTITITEEEYRRLYESDMKQRFGRDVDQVEREYCQRIRKLDRQITGLQSQLAQAKKDDSPEALHQRLQTATRLIQVLQQAGYQQAGYDFTDADRKTVLLRMERASDGSQVTVAVGQDPDLFWAKDTSNYFGLGQVKDASSVQAIQRALHG